MIFSEESFVSHFIAIENYIDGSGLGELQEHESRRVIEQLKKNLNIGMNL